MRSVNRNTQTCLLTRRAFLLVAFFACLSCFSQVRPGAMQFDTLFSILQGKRIGIVANSASMAGDSNVVDLLAGRKFKTDILFSPEHGFRMQGEAGEILGNSVDPVTGIRVVSLYGAGRKPSPADLAGLDLVLFDLQDVGVRFFTYISTLSLMMEACAEQGLPLVVLDRPNPNGHYIDGPVLEPSCSSFVGLHPVPVVYGMTIGEYARMVNGEGWLKGGVRCHLTVIPLAGYTRQTRVILPQRPSPNLPDPEAVALYPSLCFFEGTPISVGRGTDHPFRVYGHPDLHDGPYTFTPRSMPGYSLRPPCEGQLCKGEDLTEFFRQNPDRQGELHLRWLIGAYRQWKNKTTFFNDYFDKLAGNRELRRQIEEGISEENIRASWKEGLDVFRQIRVKYLLYGE